ncbi:MAG: DUF177 domain-containing protein [Gemmatimonadota bacterium]|nr:DUF177 domain-containing protein [Gemmatimonadota bacterium]
MSDSLTVSFGSLHSGPVRRAWRLEDPAELLGSLPADLEAVELEVEVVGTMREGVRARGRVRSTVNCTCRRCLAALQIPLDAAFDAWFRAEPEVTAGEDGIWGVSEKAAEIDLAPAVREEVLLGIPAYPVCAVDCAGLCPTCGVRLADEECTCPPPGPDPRWAALTELASDEE